MTSDYFNNPLAFDEQIIAEKLGIYDYAPTRENDVNLNLKLALLQEELRNSKKQLAQSKRETFIPNKKQCKCQQEDDSNDDILDFNSKESKKILLFLIVLLVAFCVFQYMSYKSEAKEMMEMLCIMLQAQKNSSPSIVPSQPIAQSIAPSQPVAQSIAPSQPVA